MDFFDFNTAANSPCLDTFTEMAKRGFSLVLLVGKRPIEPEWQRYCKEQRLFREQDFQGRNAGIATGPASGVIVLDVDDEDQFQAALLENDWELPETFTVITGSGKPHYYFQYPTNGQDYGNTAQKKLGFDVRGVGGQVVAPGSIHPDTGRPYYIENDHSIAPAPEWLLNLLKRGPDTSTNADSDSLLDSLGLDYDIINLITEGRPKGERSNALMSVLNALAKTSATDREIVAILEKYPIGEKYREKGAGRRDWLEPQLKKAKEWKPGVKASSQSTGKSVNIKEWGLDCFTGPSPDRKWLVEVTIPLAAVTVLAAAGDAGKGMLVLDLAFKIIYPDSNPREAFGHNVTVTGPAVILSAEDDQDEMHRRIERIGQGRTGPLYVVPLPSAGGPIPLIVPGKNGPELTTSFLQLREQLLDIKPVMINLDPMSSFALVETHKDPMIGAFVMGVLASLASETGAAIIISHHLSKTKEKISEPEHARSLIRGTTALVDGARGAYVLWQTEKKEARNICKTLEIEWKRNRVYQGCVVKSNGPADREIKTFIRNDVGLLQAANEILFVRNQDETRELLDMLESDIKIKAEAGCPFTITGINGFFKRKSELSKLLQNMPKHRFEELGKILLEKGRIHQCIAKGGTAKKWLDVPGGPFSLGIGEFERGAGE